MKAILQVCALDVVAKALLGVGGILLIRYVRPAEYAQLTMAWALTVLVTQTVAASLNCIYVVGHRRWNMRDSTAALVGLQFWGVLAVGLVLSAAMNVDALTGAWLTATMAASCLVEFSKTQYRQELLFWKYSAVELGRTVSYCLALLGLLLWRRDGLAAWHVLAAQCATLVAVFLVSSRGRLALGDLVRLGDAVRLAGRIVGSPLRLVFVHKLLLAVFMQVDVLAIQVWSSSQQLAAYGSALRYYGLLMLLLGAVHTVLLPMVERAGTWRELAGLLAQHRRLLAAFVPATLVGLWLAGWVMPWVDQGKYPEAVPTFRVLAISAVVSFALSPYANIVMRLDAFGFLSGVALASLAVHVGLCALLVPTWGAPGAAASTLIVSAAQNGAVYLRSRMYHARPLPGWEGAA